MKLWMKIYKDSPCRIGIPCPDTTTTTTEVSTPPAGCPTIEPENHSPCNEVGLSCEYRDVECCGKPFFTVEMKCRRMRFGMKVWQKLHKDPPCWFGIPCPDTTTTTTEATTTTTKGD